jgi:hypothetical protein
VSGTLLEGFDTIIPSFGVLLHLTLHLSHLADALIQMVVENAVSGAAL